MEDLARRMFAILAVVIVVIPVALGAPTMLVFIPPTMIVAPAVVARLAQFATRMVRLLALAPMALDRFMEMMIRLRDSLLATVAIGAQTRRAAEKEKSRQRSAGERYFSRAKNSYVSRPKNSGLKFCLHPVLLYL
jgi:hypothetical protein